MQDKIPVIGIAKRLEEIFYPNDPIPLYLDKKSVTLKIIQQLRDEAHRFGITFHRNKRSKAMIHSILQDIPGIGDVSLQKLIKSFGSVEKISDSSEEELAKVLDLKKSQAVYDFFHSSANEANFSEDK